MKRFKITTILFLIIVSVLSFALFLGGCDFVQYLEKTESQTVSDEVKQLREDYVDKLYDATAELHFREKEQKLFEYALQDAVNELNECSTESELISAYDKHIAAIGEIKTDEEYSAEEEIAALNAYRAAILAQASESYDKSKYHLSQITYLDSVFSALSEDLSDTQDVEEMNGLLQAFYFDLHKEDEILILIDYADFARYEDSQKEILNKTLNSCTENIRGCDSEEDIADIREVYKYEVYKRDSIIKIKSYVDLSLYREEQAEEIRNITRERLILAEKATNKIESDNVFREYQIAVYGIPTDETLYDNELSSLKEELNSSLASEYNLSYYRENEALAVQELLSSFKSSAESILKKEDVLSQYLLIKSRLDAIKTASVLDAEDRASLIEELYAQLLNDIDTKIDEADKAEFLAKAETVYAAMRDRVSLNGIREEYRALSQEIALVHGEAIEVLKIELTEFNNSVFYRENEKNEVKALKEEYLAKLTADLKMEDAKLLLQEAKDAIGLIKTNDDLWNDGVSEFRAALQTSFGENVLEEPKSLTEAANSSELADIIDYYAFYQISGTEFVCDTFRVKLNYDHWNAQDEINNVYWNCELLRSGAGIYGEFEERDYLVLHLIPYNLASTSNRATTNKIAMNQSLVEFKSEGQTVARPSDFENFPYKKYTKTLGGVWNTQQLWYALEHEYIPVCVAGSPAEQTLNKAKEILRGLIREGMSDEEKIFSIYSWFAENVQYDYKYTNDFYQSVLEKYAEAAPSKAFHAEGALIDGLAVCEGYAKSYLILLRIEGIESYRIVMSPASWGKIIPDSNGQITYGGGYGSHAFVGIKMSDGLLYYSDTEQTFTGEGKNLRMLQQFMVPSSLFTGYWGKTFLKPDIAEGTGYWSGYENLYVDNACLFVKNKEELAVLADIIKGKFQSGEKLCVSLFFDSTAYPAFKDDYIDLLNYNYIEKSSKNNGCAFTEFVVYTTPA